MECLDKKNTLNKEDIYKKILKELKSLISKEANDIANLANITAILKMNFEQFSWVGFYLWKDKRLVLGPFQGKPVRLQMKKGKTVFAESLKKRRTIIIPYANKTQRYYFFNPDTKSELAIPIVNKGYPYGVLNIDSDVVNAFDDIDKFYLEYIIKTLFEPKLDEK